MQKKKNVGWLVGFELNCPLRQMSVYIECCLPKRGTTKEEQGEEPRANKHNPVNGPDEKG